MTLSGFNFSSLFRCLDFSWLTLTLRAATFIVKEHMAVLVMVKNILDLNALEFYSPQVLKR